MVTPLTQKEADNVVKFLKEAQAYSEKRSEENIIVAHVYLSAAIQSTIEALEGNPKYNFIRNY